MRHALFSEVAHDNDPVLDAYEKVNLKGDLSQDPLDAAIAAYVELNGGDSNSSEVQIAVRDKIIGALIPQIANLWNYFRDASQNSERYKRYFEEKMNEVADLRAKAAVNEIDGKYRLHGPLGGGSEDSGCDG